MVNIIHVLRRSDLYFMRVILHLITDTVKKGIVTKVLGEVTLDSTIIPREKIDVVIQVVINLI